MDSSNKPCQAALEPSTKSCCVTSCSSNSRCFLKRRKPMNPLAYPMRPQAHKTAGNAVKQRVMSAKLLKVRHLQSQLNDANFHLAELTRENQTLKTLQQRQDKALLKYENANAELPRLIHCHEEEIRALTDRCRGLKKNVQELREQLKLREEELIKTKDQLHHLEKLNKDKHLTEREKLTGLMKEYKMKLEKCEEQLTISNRKLQLERKAASQRLNNEITKHKQCQRELMQAFGEIDKLTGLLDLKEHAKYNTKGSASLGSLRGREFRNKISSQNYSNQRVGEEVRDDELTVRFDINNKEKALPQVVHTSEEDLGGNLLSIKKDKQNDENRILKAQKGTGDTEEKDVIQMSEKLESAIQKATQSTKDDFDKNLSDYCSDVLSNVNTCSKVIELHKESLTNSRNDTDVLMETFQQTEKAEAKLVTSFFNMEGEMDFVKEILNEERKFQMEHQYAREGENKKGLVDVESKRKLLATLRAIDSSEDVESHSFMEEMFGNVAN